MKALIILFAAVLAACGCGDRTRSHQPAAAAAITPSAPVDVPRDVLQPEPGDIPAERPPSETAHPRILLDEATRARIRSAARRGTDTWKRVRRECEMYRDKTVGGGYRAFQWAEAVATLSLCWHATGEDEWAERAVFYLRALLDDRDEVGDGAGGDEVVRADHGYPIRSHAVYAAVGYDWLYDAPGMTEELRKHIIARLRAWIPWYRDNGYLRDNPFANYFWGWHTAITFAALATHGDNPDADDWLRHARDELLTELVIPGFSSKLRGGEWAEGWQYGQLVATSAAMIVRAYQTATGADFGEYLPWLSEVVDHQLHSLLPDRKTVYDNGTRHEKPPPPSPQALTGLLVALDHIDEDRAAEARYLLAELYPEHPRRRIWLKLLVDDVGAASSDPRRRSGLSYHLPGPGLTFARSSWDADAIWTSFQAGPRIAQDHQCNDQGHFSLWRGSDPLLVDGGGPFSYATINHNSLLIDDDSEVLSYTPNQGVWNSEARTLRYGDDGDVVVAVGDIADAWAPSCVKRGCSERAVHEAIRTFVYVRPNLLVIDDHVVVDQPGWGVSWAAHLPRAPKAKGELITGVVGDSRVDIRVLAGGEIAVHKEPTSDTDEHWEKNEPNGDMWRLEVDSERGERQRRFLHWITADRSGAEPAEAAAIEGEGLRGAHGKAGGRHVAVLFAAGGDGGAAALPAAGAEVLVITHLDPDARYEVVTRRRGGRCALRVERAADGDVQASGSGTIRLDARGCEVR